MACSRFKGIPEGLGASLRSAECRGRYPPPDTRSQDGVPKYPALMVGVAMVVVHAFIGSFPAERRAEK
jgi:hypothetical protein